jgi:O-antigen ligase
VASKKSGKLNSEVNKIPYGKTNQYLLIIAFIAAGLLIFLPPFFRGLFFNPEMYIMHIGTALVLGFIAITQWQSREIVFPRTPLDWAVLAFAGAYLISLIDAVHPGEAFYGFLRILNYLAIYWIISRVVKSWREIEYIVRILLAAGLAVAAIGVLAAMGLPIYPDAWNGQAIRSTLQYQNALGAYLSFCALVAIGMWLREQHTGWKVFYLLMIMFLIPVIIASYSKGAWLAGSIAAILLFAGVPRVYKLKTLVGALLVVITLAIVVLVFPTMSEKDWDIGNVPSSVIQSIGTEVEELINLDGSSFTSRMDFYSWGLDIVKHYPVNGTGAGGWQALYHQYKDGLLWTADVHNQFLKVWIEAGTLGFISWLALLVLAVVYVLQLRMKADERNWILIWAVVCGVSALVMHSFIDFELSIPAVFILLWVGLALLDCASEIHIPTYERSLFSPLIGKVLVACMAGILLVSGVMFSLAEHYAQQGLTYLKNLNVASDIAEQELWRERAKEILSKAVVWNPLNAEYQAEWAHLNGLEYVVQLQGDPAAAKLAYHTAKEAMDSAQRLTPNDLRIRIRLVETAALLGNVPEMQVQAQAAIQANPLAPSSYQVLAEVLWQGYHYYEQVGEQERARELAEELVNIEQMVEEQRERLNPNRTWNQNGLELPPEVKERIAVTREWLSSMGE